MEIIDYLKAVNGNSANYYSLWDVKNPRAVVQIVTGMSDYIDRYDHFAHFLNSKKILVIGHDHFGQGKAVKNKTELGNLVPATDKTDEQPEIVKRTKAVSLACKKFYPNLPLIILGHSLGSLVTTELLQTDASIYDGAILLGIINVPVATKLFMPLIKSLTPLKNEQALKRINQEAYQVYNQDFDQTNNFGWVTTDPIERKILQRDPLVGYDYTIKSWQLIVQLAVNTATNAWLATLPHEFPLLIMSGSLDPAGGYGLRLSKLNEAIASSKLVNAEAKLCYKMQHELLFDRNHDKVFAQILNFINRSITDVRS